MPHLDDNMDELFRKAAENYAPKKAKSEWDKILPSLTGAVNNDAVTKKNNSKKYTAFLLLFLLLIVSGILLIQFPNYTNEITASKKPSENIKPADVNVKADNIIKNSMLPIHKEDWQKISGYNKKDKIIEASENKPSAYSSNIIQSNIAEDFSAKSINETKKDIDNTYLQTDSANIKNNQLNNADSIQNTNSNSKYPVTFKKERKLYIGLVAGPEFNQVKNQGMQKPGFNAGIVAGYKLGAKAFIETALLLNKKKYFSDGKYFSMDKIESNMPAGMEMISLEGSSLFLQIPVKFKYNILHKNNTIVFSSAGISSYAIIDEKNDYHVLLNGEEHQMQGSYKKVTNYFAATADISAGFENKIGKFTSIRIEPYLRIPLKGIGMGSMPVTSAGLHIGITKFIH